MIILVVPFMFLSTYYGISYGKILIKNQNNKLGGIAVTVISILGSIVPLIWGISQM